MENQENKEILVKLFNKGLRIIKTPSGVDMLPNKVTELEKEEGIYILKLFSEEIVAVSEGQDATEAKDTDTALCASLKQEVKTLNEKIESLEKEEVVPDEVVAGLKDDIEVLKIALENVREEKNDLGKALNKTQKELEKALGKAKKK